MCVHARVCMCDEEELDSPSLGKAESGNLTAEGIVKGMYDRDQRVLPRRHYAYSFTWSGWN